jgi:hypothetical protein
MTRVKFIGQRYLPNQNERVKKARKEATRITFSFVSFQSQHQPTSQDSIHGKSI